MKPEVIDAITQYSRVKEESSWKHTAQAMPRQIKLFLRQGEGGASKEVFSCTTSPNAKEERVEMGKL